MKKVFLFIALIIAAPLLCQSVNTWRNYTNMENVNDVYVRDGIVWAATGGGVFSYNLNGGSFTTYNKAEGLTEFNATAISADASGKIWIGFYNGIINVLDTKTGSVRAILDLYNSDKNQPRINDILIQNDTVFISADFGISLINRMTYSFYDSFAKFGSWPYNSKINSVYIDKEIFAAGASGIAKQKPGAGNLASPDSWQIYQTGSGLPSNTVYKIVKYKGQIIAATSGGLSLYQNSSWISFVPGLNNRNIKDIFPSGDSLFILADNDVLFFYNEVLLNRISAPYMAVNCFLSDGNIFLPTNKGVFISYTNGESLSIYPNGPVGNTFPDMEADNNGTLWCASGSLMGSGINKFDGTSWSNYNSGNSNLPNNNIFRINVSPNNEPYFSSWETGFSVLRNNSFYPINDFNYPELVGYDPVKHYIEAGDVAFDSEGNTWFLNSESKGNKHLVKLNVHDSTLTQYVNLKASGVNIKALSLVIDQNDTKWFAIINGGSLGLHYYNENVNLPGATLGWGYISESSLINALVLDNRGEIWIGKEIGLSIISDPQNPLSSTFSYPMHEENINCIAVDAINQKWVGTNRGLFLLSQDGSVLLKEYTTKNSPLLSDQIISIAIDKKRGIVYAGSEKGLTALYSAYKQPEDSFSEITVYPSPFVISDGGRSEVTIDGLIKDSEVKIFNLNGKLIKEFASPGGRIAFWNGMDTDGNLVGSGIYIIAAYDAEGNNVSIAKIAVIRK